MRTSRVPGFPDPLPVADHPRAQLDPRAGTRQLNVRVLTPLLRRYQRVLRDLSDDGFQTSMTELIHAMLEQGPATPDQARAAVRSWRRTLDPDT